MREKMKKKSFSWSKRIFLQHLFDNGISQMTSQNLVVACYNSCIFHTTMFYTYTLMQTRLSANQSVCTILVIL